jgi:hypothetical protein
VSDAATVKPKRGHDFWFLLQPTTGRLWRMDARSSRVWLFDRGEVWREIRREQFCAQVEEHAVIDLAACPEVPLCAP